jgi:hypothetical protein
VYGFKPTKKQTEMIKSKGIRHYTSEASANSILFDKTVSSKNKDLVHFFVNEPTPRKVYAFNILKHDTPETPKTHVLIIENLTDEQISHIRFRPHGSVLVCKGEFFILPENRCLDRRIDMTIDTCEQHINLQF